MELVKRRHYLIFIFGIITLLVASAAAYGTTYYVDYSSGSESNWASHTCSSAAYPCKYLNHPNYTAVGGDTIYIKGTYYAGNSANANNSDSYSHPQGINPTHSGSDGQVITYTNWPGETATITADILPYIEPGYNSIGVKLEGKSYVKVNGINLTNLQRWVYIANSAHHNEISNCTMSVGPVDSGRSGTNTVTDANGLIITHADDGSANNALVGYYAYNASDGMSFCTITASTSTSITCSSKLAINGSDSYAHDYKWTSGDRYKIISNSYAGVYIYGQSTHNYIHHNIMHTYGFFAPWVDGGVALEIGPQDGNNATNSGCNYNTLSNNHVYASGHHVMGVNGGFYNVVRNNYAHNESWYDGPGCEDNKCGYRVWSMTTSPGYGGNNLLEGNKIGYGAAYGGPHIGIGGGSGSGVTLGTPSNIYRYNDHFGNALYGLRFYASTASAGANNKVYNNTFYHNGYGADDELQASTIDDFRCGLYFVSNIVTGIQIKNNLFYDQWSEANKYGVSYYPGLYASAEAQINNTILNNMVGTATYLTSATPLSSVNPIFADPDITTPLSTTKPDLTLQASSTAIDGGINLTTVHVDDIGSGTSLIATDASYFQDGTLGSDLARSALHADWICVGATIGAATCLQISAINYETNTITVADFTRADGDYVWLYKKSDGVQILYGTAPDQGAHEYVLGNNNSTMSGYYNAKGMSGYYNANGMGMIGNVSN